MLTTAIALSVFTAGCAQKKVVDIDPKGLNANTTGVGTNIGNGSGTIISDGSNQVATNGAGWSDVNPAYDNVDPYGNSNSNINGGNYRENSGDYNQNYNYNGSANGMKTIYFDVDQYRISADNLPKIIATANILKKNGRRVRVEGHCDASGTDEYNYALGLKRAKSAKDALINRGVKASNITMVSMGESAPECTTGYSSACFAKNRRVEFK